MVGGAKPPVLGQRRGTNGPNRGPKGRTEAQRAECGGGIIGEGQPASSPPARGLESAESSLRGSGAEPRSLKVFFAF